jgi:membrane protein implicated in regulation of membrane protease activity
MVFLLCLLLAVLLPIPAPWDSLLIVAGGVLEVGEVIVLRRWSKRLGRQLPVESGPEAMLGATGEVVAPCSPRGTVRIHGELWEAYCEDGAEAGTAVQVDRLDDLVLIVSPASSSRPRRTIRRRGDTRPGE